MQVAELFATLGLKLDPSEWSKGDKALDTLKAGFTGFLAVLGLNEIKGMVEEVINMGGALNDTSKQVGIQADALQELRYAASLSGVGAEELTGAITKYSRGLNEATTKHTGPVVEAFKTLGISMDQIKGETIDQNIEVIATAFQKLPDGPKKTAAAMQVFGRGGAKMVSFLDEGGEGIKRLRNEAEQLGGVMSNDTVAGMDDLGDNIDRVKFAMNGLKIQVVTALMPVLAEMVSDLLAWVKANRDLISNGIKLMIDALILSFKALAVVVGSAVDIINWFREGSDESKAALIGIATVIAAVVIPALWEMVAGWVAALAPILLVIATVALISYGVIKLIKNWDQVKVAAGKAWDWIKQKGQTLLDFLTSWPGKLLFPFVSIGAAIIKALGDAFDQVRALASDTANEIWSDIKDIPIIGRIASGAEWAVNRIRSEDDTGLANGFVAGGLPGAAQAAANQANITNNITINPSAGMSEGDIAQKVVDHDEAARRAAMDSLAGGSFR